MVQSASNYLHEVPQGRRKISSSSWEETTFNLLVISFHNLYEGRLQSSWTHLIIPSWNFVEVRWRSLFRSTSLGKRCTSYNAPPTCRKCAAYRWSVRNFLPRSSLFMVGKAQKLHGARSGLYGRCSNGVPPIHFSQAEHRIQFRSHDMRFLGLPNHEKGAKRQEISNWSTVCSTFSRSGRSVVRSASLAKGGTSKKRPSLHLHKVRIGVKRWVHKLFKQHSYYSWHIIRAIKSRKIRWTGNVARMEEMRNVWQIFIGKPEEKDAIWDNDIKMDIK
jgi:hypothetical protein